MRAADALLALALMLGWGRGATPALAAEQASAGGQAVGDRASADAQALAMERASATAKALTGSQTAEAQGAGSEAAVLKASPLDALRRFEPAANQEYELGRGDEITLNFAARPELSNKFVVGPDGRITLPLAGPVAVADKTREQAAEAVEKALSPYYSQISATIAVDKYTSNHVLLLGAVERPGIMDFDEPPTLLQVVSRGGLAAHPGKDVAIPERAAIYRGTDQVMWVDLKALLDSGNPLADVRLKRDDIVYIPAQKEKYVSVIGEVEHPGAIELTPASDLARVLAEAGGITEKAGGSPEIQVIQPSTGKKRVVRFKTLLLARQPDLALHPGDVIFVPRSGFNRVAYVMDKLNPLITLFAAAAFLGTTM